MLPFAGAATSRPPGAYYAPLRVSGSISEACALCAPAGGILRPAAAKRVQFGREEQQNERAMSFVMK